MINISTDGAWRRAQRWVEGSDKGGGGRDRRSAPRAVARSPARRGSARQRSSINALSTQSARRDAGGGSAASAGAQLKSALLRAYSITIHYISRCAFFLLLKIYNN